MSTSNVVPQLPHVWIFPLVWPPVAGLVILAAQPLAWSYLTWSYALAILFLSYPVGFLPALFTGIVWDLSESLSVGLRLTATILAGAATSCWPALQAYATTPHAHGIGDFAARLSAMGGIAAGLCCVAALLLQRRHRGS
jgi:hypothetical protein